MTADARYVPVLTGKLGEFRALGALPVATRQSLRPILDIAPIAPDKDPADIIERLLERVGRAFPNDGAAAVDLLGLEGRQASGTHPIDRLLTRAEWCAAAVQLAVRSDANPSYLAAVADHHQRSRGVCLRACVREDADPDKLAERVDEILDTLGLRPSKIHLCFDCGHLAAWGARPENVIADHLRVRPDLSSFKLVSVAGTNVPGRDEIRREERPMRVPRREWRAWQRLPDMGRSVLFGDYGITGPRPVEPTTGRPAPHLRYTTRTALLIWRGQRADLVTEEDEGQPTTFADLCRELIDHDDFADVGFSPGDNAIAEMAAGRAQTVAGQPTDGGPSHWVEWATSHHLAHVVSELGS